MILQLRYQVCYQVMSLNNDDDDDDDDDDCNNNDGDGI